MKFSWIKLLFAITIGSLVVLLISFILGKNSPILTWLCALASSFSLVLIILLKLEKFQKDYPSLN